MARLIANFSGLYVNQYYLQIHMILIILTSLALSNIYSISVWEEPSVFCTIQI